MWNISNVYFTLNINKNTQTVRLVLTFQHQNTLFLQDYQVFPKLTKLWKGEGSKIRNDPYIWHYIPRVTEQNAWLFKRLCGKNSGKITWIFFHYI